MFAIFPTTYIVSVSLWCVGREAMQVVMNTAATLGMTSGQDEKRKYVFTYVDLYNNNASYSWSRDPDTPYSCSNGKYLLCSPSAMLRGSKRSSCAKKSIMAILIWYLVIVAAKA